MEKKDLITNIFFCLMLFMIISFGCYEIGGCCMSKYESVVNCVIFIILALILVLVGVLGFKCIFGEKNCSKSINIVYVSEEKISRLPDEIDDYTIISKETDKVKKDKKKVIVLNNVILHKKMFEDINNVEKIYIFGDEIIVDSDFFEDIKGKICIIGDKDYILKKTQIESKGN